MRQKRAKIYKKLMQLYHLTFGFREPYQILVDSSMCTAATSLKIDLQKQFEIILQGNVKLMITQCSIVELYKLGKEEQLSADLAKTFERRKCNHREAINGIECIASVVGENNKHRYIIASQSDETRSRLRNVPGTPLVHLNRTVMVLEPPSDATMEAKRQMEEKALLPTASTPSDAKAAENIEQPKKKRKGPKAPNPLSVKKKKVRTRGDEDTGTGGGDVSGQGQVKTGTKRKLTENDEAGTVSHPHSHEENENEKPKRKRRKKLKPQNDTAE